MTIIFFIRIYQKIISPWLPLACRFEPTCSHYAVESFRRHSTAKAFYFSLKRLIRCHPFCNGGYDPVPRKGRG